MPQIVIFYPILFKFCKKWQKGILLFTFDYFYKARNFWLSHFFYRIVSFWLYIFNFWLPVQLYKILIRYKFRLYPISSEQGNFNIDELSSENFVFIIKFLCVSFSKFVFWLTEWKKYQRSNLRSSMKEPKQYYLFTCALQICN